MIRLLLAAIIFIYLPVLAQSQKPPVVLGEKWIDVEGNPINAHGAGILFYRGVYYMFGEIKKGKTVLVPGQNWEDYRVPAGGISCYSSTDLLHWKNEGLALAPTTGDTASDLDTGRVIERPKVIYNSRTKKFVMWMHIDKSDYSYARAGVAVSAQPNGPFKYIKSIRPNDQMSRDITVFQDDDNRAYLVYASENNLTMQICLLTDDYLSATANYKRILINQHREAPALFKHNREYFLITSLCSGWDPNAATYAVADHIMGEWKQLSNPCVGADAENTFHAQSTYVLPLKNKKNTYIFLADKWNKLNLEDSRYLWLPFQVKDDKIEIKLLNAK